MALTEQQLISWSRDIRDVLAGRVKQSDGSCIDQEMTMTFNAFFSTLLSTEMSLDIFRKTRIHFALLEIITKDSGWPEGLQKVARLLVDKWERLFGTLEEIEADPWAEGGRMYGVYKLVDFRKLGLESNTVRKNEASEECGSEAWGRKLSSTWEIVHLASWSIQGSKGDPFRVGHIGFNVGEYEQPRNFGDFSLTELVGGSSLQRRTETESSTKQPVELQQTLTRPSLL